MLPNSNFDLNNQKNIPQNNNYNPEEAFNATHREDKNSPKKEEDYQYIYEEKKEKTEEQINVETGQTRALIAYLGPFVLIPYFQEKENPFVLYHVKQGMNLFIIEVIIVVILEIIKFAFLKDIFWIVSIVDFCSGMFVVGLSLIGIYYVLEGKMKEIPIVGSIKLIR